MRRKPVHGILVEEGPRRNNGDKSEGGTGKEDPEGKGDVLGGVADDKSDNLGGVRNGRGRIAVRIGLTPAVVSSAVVKSSARRWPSKSYMAG